MVKIIHTLYLLGCKLTRLKIRSFLLGCSESPLLLGCSESPLLQGCSESPLLLGCSESPLLLHDDKRDKHLIDKIIGRFIVIITNNKTCCAGPSGKNTVYKLHSQPHKLTHSTLHPAITFNKFNKLCVQNSSIFNLN